MGCCVGVSTETVVNRFVNYNHRRKRDKRLTFWTKVLRRSECELYFVFLKNQNIIPLTPTKDFSPKRQCFIHFSTVYIIYKSIYILKNSFGVSAFL